MAGWLGFVAATVGRQVGLRVGAVKVVRVHFNVGIELLEGVRRTWVTTEEDRRIKVAQLDFDTDLVPPVFDQRLEILTHSVGRGLVQQGQFLTVFVTDAIAIAVGPAGFFQQGFGTFKILRQTFSVVGCVKLGGGYKVTGCTAGLAVAHFDQQRTVDRHGKRLADLEVRQDRVRMRKRRTFTFWQLWRRIGHVHFDPFDQGTECRDRLTFTAFGHLR